MYIMCCRYIFKRVRSYIIIYLCCVPFGTLFVFSWLFQLYTVSFWQLFGSLRVVIVYLVCCGDVFYYCGSDIIVHVCFVFR